jgi:hypothetical protein
LTLEANKSSVTVNFYFHSIGLQEFILARLKYSELKYLFSILAPIEVKLFIFSLKIKKITSSTFIFIGVQ